jgi:hypothetical protein
VDSVILSIVGLNDYRRASWTVTRRRALGEALCLLAAKHKGAFSETRRYVDRIVPFEAKDRSVPAISSTSFGILPGVVFVSHVASRYLPPRVVAPSNLSYVLGENIYHEAVHHGLTKRIQRRWDRDRDVLRKSKWKMLVPWREEWWTLEHALQAAYVYYRVTGMREVWVRQLSAGDPLLEVASEARAQSAEALTVITRALIKAPIPSSSALKAIVARLHVASKKFSYRGL